MKTIVKFTAGALLALSVAAPALAYNPEAQLLVERSMVNVGQSQAYSAYAQDIGAPTSPIAPEAQLLAERGGYQDQGFNARAQADAVTHSRAGTRR